MAYFYGGYKGDVDPDDSCSSDSNTEGGSNDVTDSDSDGTDSVKGGFWGGVPRQPNLTSKDRKVAAKASVLLKNKATIGAKTTAKKKSDTKKAIALLADKNERKIENKVLKELKTKASTSKQKKNSTLSGQKPKPSLSRGRTSIASLGAKTSSEFVKCKTYTVTRVLTPHSKFCERGGTKGGRFKATTPMVAAKKAASKIFSYLLQEKNSPVKKIVYELRCLTRRSNKEKLFEYEATVLKSEKRSFFDSNNEEVEFTARKIAVKNHVGKK